MIYRLDGGTDPVLSYAYNIRLLTIHSFLLQFSTFWYPDFSSPIIHLKKFFERIHSENFYWLCKNYNKCISKTSLHSIDLKKFSFKLIFVSLTDWMISKLFIQLMIIFHHQLKSRDLLSSSVFCWRNVRIIY